MAFIDRLRNWYFSFGFLIFGVLVMAVGLVNTYALFRDGQVVAADSRVEQGGEAGKSVCGEDCIKTLVGEAVASLSGQIADMPTVVAVPTLAPTPGAEKKAVPVSLSTNYVKLVDAAGGGTEWVTVGSGKWLDTSLYGSLEGASWMGWISTSGGSGEAFTRLYDATNDRGVDGSEVKVTDTTTTSFYTGNISLWRGQNQYFIQVKSSSGEQVSVSQAQIKLVVR